MTNVIRIPSTKKDSRQRVFALGRAYIGSSCSQDLIDLYLKRRSRVEWALQTYVGGRVVEMATYSGDQLVDVLQDYEFCEPTTVEDLMACGWQPSAAIYDFESGEVLQ